MLSNKNLIFFFITFFRSFFLILYLYLCFHIKKYLIFCLWLFILCSFSHSNAQGITAEIFGIHFLMVINMKIKCSLSMRSLSNINESHETTILNINELQEDVNSIRSIDGWSHGINRKKILLFLSLSFFVSTFFIL